MKKFVAGSVVLGMLFVFAWIDFLPVPCDTCGKVVFRTDLTSLAFGGHGVVVHQSCFGPYASQPLPGADHPEALPLNLEFAERPLPAVTSPTG
jgi:hypothetical protein